MSVGAVIYARASTEELAADALTLAAQHAAAAAAVAERDWRIHACALDRGVDSSVAPDERPALGPALADLAGHAAGALVVARLDRVTHSVRVWVDLVERSYQRRWGIVVVEEGLELPSDQGERAVAFFAAAARVEKRWRSTRSRAGLAAAQAVGTRLGRPVEHSAEARRLVAELRAAGNTFQQIADHLTATGIPTPRGGRWRAGTVHKLHRSARLDEAAAAGGIPEAAEAAPTIATPPADQAARAADFDRRFPASYNLSQPPVL